MVYMGDCNSNGVYITVTICVCVCVSIVVSLCMCVTKSKVVSSLESISQDKESRVVELCGVLFSAITTVMVPLSWE